MDRLSFLHFYITAIISMSSHQTSTLSSADTRAFVVDQIDPLTHDSVAITLASVDGLPLAFHPGQYVSLTVRLPDQTLATRAYSIASAPDALGAGRIKVGVKRIEGGRVSTFLTQTLRVGEALELKGPFGEFGPHASNDAPAKSMLLIAGGSGITPLLSIALATLQAHPNTQVTLLHRARNEAALMFAHELSELSRNHPHRFQHIPLLSAGDANVFKGWSSLLEAHPHIAHANAVYMCGPTGLMNDARAALTDRGVRSDVIHVEQFDSDKSRTPTQSKVWSVTVLKGEQSSTCQVREGDTLLDALEQAGHAVAHSCRVGTCGSCKVGLQSGTTTHIAGMATPTADPGPNQVLSCVCTPQSDLTVRVPEINQATEAHPAVVRWFKNPSRPSRRTVSRQELKELALACGADDAGFAAVDRPSLSAEWPHLQRAFPQGRTYIGLVRRMNATNVRSAERSIANADFHHTMDDIQHIARKFADALIERGIKAFCAPPAFPMEMDRFPERGWVIAHKTIAEATGLGRIGLHRNVIHPQFGNFILLDTIVIDRDVDEEDRPLEENPCIGCNLCVAACPVGAINTDGHFDFTACYTHNYREFMSGFSDWVETVADAKSAKNYRAKVSDSETVSMWQSLSFGPNYKAAYCLSVCPAGSDVIGDFLANRKQFVNEVLLPLQAKSEPIYVVPGSDAERFVKKKYPHKPVRRVSNGLRVRDIKGFLHGLRISFQRGKAGNLSATYHFTFTGAEPTLATVKIHNRKIEVLPDLVGRADLQISADSSAWLRFMRKEAGLLTILATRKLRLSGGSPKLMASFGRCFL